MPRWAHVLHVRTHFLQASVAWCFRTRETSLKLLTCPDHGRQICVRSKQRTEASESDLESDAPPDPAALLVRELKVNALINSRPTSLDGGCEGAVVAARRGRGMGPSDNAAQGPVVGAADIVLYHFRHRQGM